MSRQSIRNELKAAERLGTMVDKKQILLLDCGKNTAFMNELGRLREMTFQSIGEGTGRS